MRNQFDKQLQVLHKSMITMGGLNEQAIAMSVKALQEGDMELAGRVQELSGQIEEKEREIEGMCMKLLLQQQPVARDLRVISSALKMVTDMERVGHQSADIAEIIRLSNIQPRQDVQGIRDMAQATIKMVTDAVDAFVKQDVDAARAVIAYDDVVDTDFDQVKHTLIGMLRQPDADTESAVDLLMIAKYFERIGDHAVNIANWVLFAITGAREEV